MKDSKTSKIIRTAKDSITTAPKKIIEYSAKYKVGLIFWILLIAMFVLGVLFIANIKNFAEGSVEKYGYLGIFIIAIFAELFLTPIGPEIPMITGILLKLSPWTVLLSALTGIIVSILIAYYVGVKIGIPGVERIMGTKSYSKIKKYETKGKWFILLGAITPIPYVPYFAGVWKLSFKDTLLFVAIPRIARLSAIFVLTYFLGIQLFGL